MIRGTSIVVTALVVATALAGCATSAPADDVTGVATTLTAAPSASPTPTPTPTSTPTPVVNDPADPSTWVITQDAVGPIVVGAAEPDAATTAAFANAPCPGTDTTWYNRDGKAGLVTIAPQGVVSLVGVVGSDLATSPRTAAGIGVGSTKQAFLAAYPDAHAKDLDNPNYGSTWVVAVGPGHIAFNVPTGEDTVQTILPGDTVPTEYCG